MRRSAILIALALAGCGPPDQQVAIRFEASADGRPLSCANDAEGQRLSDLRFFIHDIELLTADGDAERVTLDVAPPWQNKNVALVDLEDGSGTCDTGSPMTHSAITGKVPAGDYIAMRFILGVPFDLNHADPAIAERGPALKEFLPHLKLLDGENRGYVLIEITPDRLRGEWYHVATVYRRTAEERRAAAFVCERGSSRLVAG